MSTRCQIVVLESDGSLYPCKIYKHGDGYPAGVLPELSAFAKEFAANRGDDAEYWVAQCVRRFALADKRDAATSSFGVDPWHEFTGWGVSTYWHGDIEYLYVVKPDGSIQVLDPDIREDQPRDALPQGKGVTADAFAEAAAEAGGAQ